MPQTTATYATQSTSIVYKPDGWQAISLRLGRAAGDSVDGGYVTPERWTVDVRHGYTLAIATTDDTIEVLITFGAQTDEHNALIRIMAANELLKATNGNAIVTGSFKLSDPTTREFISIPRAILTSSPRIGLGEGAPTRQWRWAGAGVISALPPT